MTTNPVIVVIGPSGSGKSSAVHALHHAGLVAVHPTWTTRPRRVDEQRGSLEHRFVTDEVFDALEVSDFFLDTVTMFGLPHRYGLPPVRRCRDGRLDLVMLRAPLVESFARLFPDHVVVQIEAPDAAARLFQRATDADDLAARLADNERELALGRAVADHIVTNEGPFDAIVGRLVRILQHDLVVGR